MAEAKKRGEIQKCKICGNVIEVLHADGGPLVCCGEPMELLLEKTLADEGKEKHVPVIDPIKSLLSQGARDEQSNGVKNDGVKIKVGSVPHPMEEKHYIEWIEIWPEGEEKSCRKYLKPGSAPEAEFGTKAEKILARAYCNIHGLWKN